jgi:hypothetical protein
MALAFHAAMTDGALPADDLEDIRVSLQSVFNGMSAIPQATGCESKP